MTEQNELEFKEIYSENIDYDVMKNDMVCLYKEKFSKKGQPGREYYNLIRVLTSHCPYCQHNQIKQVDHYLPKSKKPTLAVTPLNLIPACKDCNEGKHTNTGFFHPYFDDVDSNQYLYCKVSFKDDDIVFTFFAKKPLYWEETFYEKVENLFTKMNDHDLLEMFRVEARLHFNMLKRNVIKSAKRGKDDLIDTLNDYYESAVEEIGLNSWQSALFNGLLEEIESVYTYLILQ